MISKKMADEQNAAVCSVCLRSICLTSAGVVRSHGPVSRRCQGSGRPPRARSGNGSTGGGQPCGKSPSSPPSPTSQLVSSLPQGQGQGAVATDFTDLPEVRVLRRIPKAAREQCSLKLASILEDVVGMKNVQSWSRLFRFATTCLRQPSRGDTHQSLASKIKAQVREEVPPRGRCKPGLPRKKTHRDPLESLARQVSRKIDDGDLRGAIRLASSEDMLADHSVSTFAALQA